MTRKPSFALPPGACDCHTHVFGSHRLYPLAQSARYAEVDNNYVRRRSQEAYGREIIEQIKLKVRVHRRDDDYLRCSHDDCVPVWGSAAMPFDRLDHEREEFRDVRELAGLSNRVTAA